MSEGQPIYAMEIKSRAHERLAWGLETVCRLLADEERSWPTLVRDLSRGGVGLVLDDHIEPGSELAIEIPHSGEHLHVQIVHATAMPGGQWLLGCSLATLLTEEEVQQLLTGGGKPQTAPDKPKRKVSSPKRHKKQQKEK